jgi:hypothetical protein
MSDLLTVCDIINFVKPSRKLSSKHYFAITMIFHTTLGVELKWQNGQKKQSLIVHVLKTVLIAQNYLKVEEAQK